MPHSMSGRSSSSDRRVNARPWILTSAICSVAISRSFRRSPSNSGRPSPKWITKPPRVSAGRSRFKWERNTAVGRVNRDLTALATASTTKSRPSFPPPAACFSRLAFSRDSRPVTNRCSSGSLSSCSVLLGLSGSGLAIPDQAV